MTTATAPDAARLRALEARVAELEAERATLTALVDARGEELAVAARMLRARAATMTGVVDAITRQSVVGTDLDGVVRVWNPGAERLLGVPRAAVVRRRRITDFHDPAELGGRGLDALVRTAAECGSDVRDWTYVAADGTRRTVSVAVTPRSDGSGPGGGQDGWTFVGTDMTEVRAAERLKDQFVALVSHELRTPLSSVLGYLELVLDDPDLGAGTRRHLGTVQCNAARLERLVGDLLFTAQVEAGRFALTPGEVDLAALLRAAGESAQVTADGAGVTLAVTAPASGPVVPGDALRLGQAVDNLVSNAVKFTPRGGRVELGLGTADGRAGSPAGGEVSIEVRDTGVGIPGAERAGLGTRFTRATTAVRAGVPGVGLGLSITHAIAAAHGGRLELASTEGRGTTATLVLPR
ncbi:PAS domain-containing sensor histidine kinase [Geodermatophilus nigrescens]|uniref:histidine kinase n=1 Tax=Geodermatophilus nigrescens TaxID=1070870 RepID=A0A1M5F3T3_9ACTN|nr:PAS domain-containing sensor histidine kinase [Geodermatophilus nigrescens]SHF85752.1 PAS fold [Geodermatophilus nigrescens]